MFYLVLFVLLIVVAVIVFVICLDNSGSNNRHDYSEDHKSPGLFEWMMTPEYKRVGIRGEVKASNAILSVMRDDDRLFTNVSINYDGRPAELDNVIVNKYGVFVIEVKNYAGAIYGNEDDFEWQKYKTTDAGNTYVKTVKNPIKQVKRQCYLLARYLENYGTKVWVDGYAILIQGNSPVVSDYILNNIYDIEHVIHTPGRKMLSPKTIDDISRLLSR